MLLVNGAYNVRISGIQVINSGSGYSGIYLYKCSNCVVENNKLTNNGYGIRLTTSNQCTVSGNAVLNNKEYGIELGDSKSNTVSGNTVSNNYRGLYLGASDDNTVSGNTVTYNNYLGFYECDLCDRNLVFNNYFNNTVVTVKSGSGNSYNTTKTPGTSIVGGPYIGGNYWGKPDGTGFSDKAVDSDGDGIADSAYHLPGESAYKDYLPLVRPSSPASASPVADFSSSVTSGNAPLNVQFTDLSTGTPTTWSWDFGDGSSSAEQSPVHTYSVAGSYTVSLTVSNANGMNSKTSEIEVLGTALPVANFSTNATKGFAPLAIQFTDLSQNAIGWNWDFGDGSNSIDQNPAHIYGNPGDYNVSLTVSDANGMTASKTLEIKVLQKEGLPVADFEANVTNGYAPLSVLFTDHSQNAKEIGWDFDDNGVPEVNSSTAVYVYTSPGTYNVNLIATNKNGTSIKTATITVDDEDSSGSDGGSSHHSSSGGGGGTGGSPEPQNNVEFKELSQMFITNGKAVQFDFPKNATCVVDVGFDAIKTVGKTTTIAEQLKNKSTLVSGLPEGEVYKYFNTWVGNGGYATSENIENPVLGFKVEKTWLQNESIDQNSITLNRYEDEDKYDGKDGNWTSLSTNLTGEDDKYLYFTANVPGYGSFAITGKAVQQVAKGDTQIPAEERSVGEPQTGKNETQGAGSDGNSSNDIMLSLMIVIVVLVIIGIVMKSAKK